MPSPNVTPIDDLLWTATRYSDVLKLDRRVVAQALETAPSQERNGVRVWHVRDAFRAIATEVGGSAKKLNPDDMEPKDQLDHWKAANEKLKFAENIGKVVPAAHIERTLGAAFKALAQTLDSLPDALERDCGLPPLAVTAVQQAVDGARNQLYDALMSALDAKNG